MAKRLRFRQFEPGHLDRIDVGPLKDELNAFKTLADNPKALALPGLAYSAVYGGRVVCCGGVVPQHASRAIAWMLVGAMPRRAWPAVFDMAAMVIANAHHKGYRRVEATADVGFPAAIRWLRRLDFEVEAELECWSPQGHNHFLFKHMASVGCSTGGDVAAVPCSTGGDGLTPQPIAAGGAGDGIESAA